MLRHLVAEFALRTKLDLLILLLRERSIGHLRVVDIVEILADGRKCLVAETSSTLEVPIAVLLMKRHINHSILSASLGAGMSPAGRAAAEQSISSNLQR